MAEIVLNYDSCSSLKLAKTLKTDIKNWFGLPVSLAADDWEDASTDNFGLSKLEQASLLFVLEFEDQNITCLISLDKELPKKLEQKLVGRGFFPRTIDFTESYHEGMDVLLYVLEECLGSEFRRRVQDKKRNSEKQAKEAERRKEMEQAVTQMKKEKVMKKERMTFFNKWKSLTVQ